MNKLHQIYKEKSLLLANNIFDAITKSINDTNKEITVAITILNKIAIKLMILAGLTRDNVISLVCSEFDEAVKKQDIRLN